MKKYDANVLLQRIIRVGNIPKKKTVAFLLAKFLEEAGEFSQASLTKSGDLPKKKLKHKDHVFEEACDSIIMILDTVGRLYRKEIKAGKLTEEDLLNKILGQIPTKINKWKVIENIKE